MYKCLECETLFNEHTAYCENREDFEKRFGCPNCKTFYLMTKDKHRTKSFVLTLIVIFSGLGCADAISSGDVKFSIQFGIIFLLVVAYMFKYVPLQTRNTIKKVQP